MQTVFGMTGSWSEWRNFDWIVCGGGGAMKSRPFNKQAKTSKIDCLKFLNLKFSAGHCKYLLKGIKILFRLHKLILVNETVQMMTFTRL